MLCIRLIERLYNYYPTNRSKLEDLIMVFFSKINSESTEDLQFAAANFLFRLINRNASEAFKATLETRETLQIFFKSPGYSSSVLEDLDIIELQDIHLKAGFPFNRTVEASNNRSEYIEIWQPYSILSFGFLILQHDLTFSIERVSRFKNVLARETDEASTLIKDCKINSSKKPVRGNIIIKEPGLYHIQFNNKGSWLNTKTVRYRMLILTPVYEESSELNRIRESVIEANLGQVYLPSQIFGPDVHAPSNAARSNNAENSTNIHSQKSSARIRILLHIDSEAVQFWVAIKDKKDGFIFQHESDGRIDWETSDLKMKELSKDSMDAMNVHKSDKINLQIVYDELFIAKLLNIDRSTPNFNERVESYFISSIPFLSEAKKYLIEQKPQILTEMEFQVYRLANDIPWFDAETFMMFVLDHKLKVVQCKLRKETKETFDVDLGDFVIPVITEPYEGKQVIELKPAEILLFQEDLPITQRIAYLAFLIHCIFCSSIRSIKDFVIMEDSPVLLDYKSFNRITLKEAIDSYYISYKKTEIQEHSLDPLHALNIHFSDKYRKTNIKL